MLTGVTRHGRAAAGALVRAARTVAVCALCAGAVAGCGTDGPPARGSAGSTPGGDAGHSVAQAKASVAATAERSGDAPTDAGVSTVGASRDAAGFLWETAAGKICLADRSLSGTKSRVACGTVPEGARKDKRGIVPLFGPGTGYAGTRIVFLAHGEEVVSATYGTTALHLYKVRTIEPETGGGDVYYAALPGLDLKKISVEVRVGGALRADTPHAG